MKRLGIISFWMLRIGSALSVLHGILTLFDKDYRINPLSYLLVAGILTFILWKAKYTEASNNEE